MLLVYVGPGVLVAALIAWVLVRLRSGADARVQLELLEEHRFGNGVVNLRYRIRS